jgi:hypothetical protein
VKKILLSICLLFIAESCYIGMSIDERRREERLRASKEMFKEVKRVRKKCVPLRKRVGSPRKRKYYS